MTPSLAMALPYIPRFSKDELASSLRNLLPDQRCLVNDLRDYILVNGAIPDDDELVCQIALGFRFTRRKFYKYWPYLKTFFTRVGQLFVFGRDEDLRIQAVEYRSKFSEAGKLGAEIKKQRAHNRSEFSTSPPSAPLQQPPPYPPPIQEILPMGGYPAATYLTREEEAAAPPPIETFTETPARSVSPEDCDELAKRCIRLGMPAPDQQTAIQILQLHSTVSPERFPLFPSQRSSGLYLKKSRRDVLLEIARSASPELSRKPNANEEHWARQREWAKREDEKRRNQC